MKFFEWIPVTGKFLIIALILFVVGTTGFASDPKDATIIDSRHYSNVFGETRNYRIFLPPGYFANSEKKYAVIYFFHGWSQRYFGSSDPYGDFDKGDENGGDNIANFVSSHDVIVVKPDGYNRSPDEKYYVRPYNVTPVETYRQFPIYFPELIEHIDAHYRTIPDRGHRGIAGLSMGGFMTFWIGGKYPHLVSAAGSFCGSPEFEVGPKDFPVEYRHLDMHKNYEGMNVRLHYGDKDFIRGYHEDLNRVWTQVMDNYGYKVFDAGHSTCGMAEMLSFILDTFENPPRRPTRWHHTDAYPEFSVWDYKVMTDRVVPGFTILEKVDQRGFRCSVRDFLPDGELLPSVNVLVKTPPIYDRNRIYTITDMDVTTLKVTQHRIRSDEKGHLTIRLDGGLHEIGVNEQSDKANLAIASVEVGSAWATAQETIQVTLKIINKGLSLGKGIRATFTPTRTTAEIITTEISVGNIPVNETVNTTVKLRVNVDSIEIEKIKVTLRDDRKNEWVEFFEIPLKKKASAIQDFEIADGRVLTVAKSGVDSETVLLGHGNGDGVANPGEIIIILAKELGKLWRTDLTVKDRYINPFGIRIRHSDNWSSFDHVGGSAKYDAALIASDCPENHTIDLFAEYWLPDHPRHKTKQGKLQIRVQGQDTTPPAIRSVVVSGDNVLQVKIYDGSLVKNAKATLILEDDPKKSLTLELSDDSRNGDQAAGDHLFSRTIPSQVFGIFRAVIEAVDADGNKAVIEQAEKYVLH